MRNRGGDSFRGENGKGRKCRKSEGEERRTCAWQTEVDRPREVKHFIKEEGLWEGKKMDAAKKKLKQTVRDRVKNERRRKGGGRERKW